MKSRSKITFVSAPEAEDCDILVCMDWSVPLLLPDNARGACAACGAALQFRPDAPKRPMRLCMKCAIAYVRPN